MEGGPVNTTWNSEDSFWKRTIVYSALAALVVVGGGFLYYFKVMKPGAQPEVKPRAEARVAPPAPAEPEHHPLASAAPSATPLPALNQSDAPLAAALAEVFGKKPVGQLLVPEQIIRHIVVTVDNLPRTKVAEQMRPMKATSGETVTVANGDTITLSADNYARYAPVIRIVQGTDTKQLGALYLRYYPLFQQAYEDLGYPGQYFNDRLVQVIDHLLETPDLRGPIELRQGKVFYEYADPALESRSAGQKLLMRMGPDNAAVIKKKLRELRTFVTTSQDPPQAPQDSGSGAGAGTAGTGPAQSSEESQAGPSPQALPNDEATPTGPAH
jgi:Protein of unknown function (DUF3014)